MKNMTDTFWDEIEKKGCFSRNEKSALNSMNNAWGDPLLMAQEAISLQQLEREEIGVPCHIHCGFDFDGHASRSFHKRKPCAAIDKHYAGITLYKTVAKVLTFNWSGVGAYPFWKPAGGIHTDLRSNPLFWIQTAHRTEHYLDVFASAKVPVLCEKRGYIYFKNSEHMLAALMLCTEAHR